MLGTHSVRIRLQARCLLFFARSVQKENQMTTQTSRHLSDSSASSRSSKGGPVSMKHSDQPLRQVSGNHLGSWHVLTELGRQQLAVAAESTSALYRSREALRKVQQETAHEASLHYAQAAQKLCCPCQPADMLAVQTELMRTSVQSAAHYWQQLMVVALQASIQPMASSFFVHGPSDSSEPH